jgi:hypothetical protein
MKLAPDYENLYEAPIYDLPVHETPIYDAAIYQRHFENLYSIAPGVDFLPFEPINPEHIRPAEAEPAIYIEPWLMDNNPNNDNPEQNIMSQQTPNTPQGWLDSIDANGQIKGWTQDQNNLHEPTNVHIYIDEGAIPPATNFVMEVRANEPKTDIDWLAKYGNHGFTAQIPQRFFDGQPHNVYAYGIDTNGNGNMPLSGSPKIFQSKQNLSSGIVVVDTLPPVVDAIVTTTAVINTTAAPADENLIFGYPAEYVLGAGAVLVIAGVWLTSK